MSEAVLTPGQVVRPDIDDAQVRALVRDLYGLHVLSSTELNSYDDRNFHIYAQQISENPNLKSVSSSGYVLKVLNSLDSKFEAAIDAQTALICHLNDVGLRTPKVLKTIDNRMKSLETLRGGGSYLLRLLEYLPGRILKELACDKDIAFETGRLSGQLNRSCQNFYHPGFDNYKRIWSLTEVTKLTDFLPYIDDLEQKTLIQDVIESFYTNVMEKYDQFSKGIIHGDLNEGNILLQQKDDGRYHVTTVLDFGDSAYSCHVFDIAICMSYLMQLSSQLDPIRVSGYTLAGYLSEFHLPQTDLRVLIDCICARFAQSLIICAYSAKMNPEKSDNYLASSPVKWRLLKMIRNMSDEEVTAIWRKCREEFNIQISK